MCATSRAQSGIDPRRVSFSSGGGSNARMPVTMGEPFGKANNGVTIGSQQNSGLLVSTTPADRPNNRIVVFPNPTQDELNVQVVGESQNGFTVKLYDMTGREILVQKNVNEYVKLTLTGLAGNSFVVVLYDDKGVNLFSETIIKP